MPWLRNEPPHELTSALREPVCRDGSHDGLVYAMGQLRLLAVALSASPMTSDCWDVAPVQDSANCATRQRTG